MALQISFEASIKSFNHAIGLGRHRQGQAVFDLASRAKHFHLVFASCGAPAQAKQPISERSSIVDHNSSNADWPGMLQVTQEPARISCFALKMRSKNLKSSVVQILKSDPRGQMSDSRQRWECPWGER